MKLRVAKKVVNRFNELLSPDDQRGDSYRIRTLLRARARVLGRSLRFLRRWSRSPEGRAFMGRPPIVAEACT